MNEPMYVQDEYDEEDYEYYPDQEYSHKISLDQIYDLYRYCVQPTISEAYTNLIILFASCTIFRLVISSVRQPDTAHQLSSVIGLYMLFIYFKWDFFHVFVLTIAGYVIILILSNSGSTRGYVTCIILISYLVICEITINATTWQKIRGAQMIAAMKIISVAFDLDGRVVRRVDIFEYGGYILDLGTCIWGPWVSFSEYRAKQEGIEGGWQWIKNATVNIILSLLFFTTCVCWLDYLIPTAWGGWWTVYRDALSFRMSHYFVSSVSVATTVLSGYEARSVSKPWEVEVPRSLASVVINWNIPMHKWLKMYVFKTVLCKSGGFAAVMATYVVSSFLHGLNVRLAAVLLSLGVYTYTEYSLRSKLSERFSACILSKSCPKMCTIHRYTSSNLLVNTTNIFFSVLAMFHLAYLGVLMDTNEPQPLNDTFSAWQNLRYMSHWVMMLTLVVNLCI